MSLSSASVGIGAGSVAILSGLTETVMIPILNSGFKMDLLKAKCISEHILLSSLAATIFNWFELSSSGYTNQSHGFIVYPFGVKVAAKMGNKWINIMFVLFGDDGDHQ